jgi:hypothetical protein
MLTRRKGTQEREGTASVNRRIWVTHEFGSVCQATCKRVHTFWRLRPLANGWRAQDEHQEQEPNQSQHAGLDEQLSNRLAASAAS